MNQYREHGWLSILAGTPDIGLKQPFSANQMTTLVNAEAFSVNAKASLVSAKAYAVNLCAHLFSAEAFAVNLCAHLFSAEAFAVNLCAHLFSAKAYAVNLCAHLFSAEAYAVNLCAHLLTKALEIFVVCSCFLSSDAHSMRDCRAGSACIAFYAGNCQSNTHHYIRCAAVALVVLQLCRLAEHCHRIATRHARLCSKYTWVQARTKNEIIAANGLVLGADGSVMSANECAASTASRSTLGIRHAGTRNARRIRRHRLLPQRRAMCA